MLPSQHKRHRSSSLDDLRLHTYSNLKNELITTKQELCEKEAECKRLNGLQDQINNELQDLTASLFEEANKMIQEAHVKRIHAEKKLTEAESKIDVLLAEVAALKELVMTSTPSMPNRHLHPQIAVKNSNDKNVKHTEKEGFSPGHRRSTSHHAFTQSSDMSKGVSSSSAATTPANDIQISDNVDNKVLSELKAWRLSPNLDDSSKFIQRIFQEDIIPCLSFVNENLSQEVKVCIMSNTLTIEPVTDKNSTSTRCNLTNIETSCKFALLLNDSQPGLPISMHARNRVAAVCELISYIRYIQQGLVRSNDETVYWEIAKRRKQLALARLGLQ